MTADRTAADPLARRPLTPASAALDLARGGLMGAADVVPGVSGGTIALIVGVYERLLTSIRAVAAAVVLALAGRLTGARARAGEAHWGMVVPLGTGVAVMLVVGFRTIPALLDEHPVTMRALLLGLVLASVAVPWRRLERRTPLTGLALAGAALLAFVAVGLPPADLADPSLAYVFVAAMVALCAMILPGVSGSFLLEALGVYRPLGDAVSTVDVPFLVTFGLGGVIGLGLFARLLEWLLARHHDLTMAALTGLLVGALRALWPWQAADRSLLAPRGDAGDLALVAALVALGVAIVATLTVAGERAARRRGETAG